MSIISALTIRSCGLRVPGTWMHLAFFQGRVLCCWVTGFFYSVIIGFRFPRCASGKNLSASTVDVRDVGSVPGLRTSPGGRHGNPLHYSCLENPMD